MLIVAKEVLVVVARDEEKLELKIFRNIFVAASKYGTSLAAASSLVELGYQPW